MEPNKDKKDEVENVKNDDNKKYQKDMYEASLNKKKKIVLISSISCGAILLLVLFCTIFALFNINNNKIISGVKINDIEIKKLTKEEAKNKINDVLQNKLEKDISFDSEDFNYSIKLSQIETKYDIDKAIDEAYNVGRKSNIFVNNFEIIKTKLKGKNVKLEYTYNEQLLNDIINDIAAKVPNAVIEANYDIEGDKLIISKGKEGNSIDN